MRLGTIFAVLTGVVGVVLALVLLPVISDLAHEAQVTYYIDKLKQNGYLAFKVLAQDLVSINQSLVPDADNTYDLGSSTNRWRNLYVQDVVSPDGVHGTDIEPQSARQRLLLNSVYYWVGAQGWIQEVSGTGSVNNSHALNARLDTGTSDGTTTGTARFKIYGYAFNDGASGNIEYTKPAVVNVQIDRVTLTTGSEAWVHIGKLYYDPVGNASSKSVGFHFIYDSTNNEIDVYAYTHDGSTLSETLLYSKAGTDDWPGALSIAWDGAGTVQFIRQGSTLATMTGPTGSVGFSGAVMVEVANQAVSGSEAIMQFSHVEFAYLTAQ